MQEEADCIQRVLDGDTNAFRMLVDHYQQRVYAVAIAVLKDSELAKEASQDAFVKAFRRIGSFRRESSFSTWLYRIATNEALMRLRKRNADPLIFSSELPEGHQQVDMGELPQEEAAKLVNKALMLLPPRESLALRLFYLEESDIQTVSAITGWTGSNTKVILHRARQRMAVVINELKQNKHV